MRRVDAWQLAHPVQPPENRDWERGTWYTGVMAAYQATGDRAFLRQALDWGRRSRWKVGEKVGAGWDGANRLFSVETWVKLYFVKKNRAMIEPAVRWLNTREPDSPAGQSRWYLEEGDNGEPAHVYVDSLYGAPALAMLAKASGNARYLNIMQSFFDTVTGELYDRKAGLYYRDPSFIGRKTARGKRVFWSRGNGWAFAGIARILEYLPENYSGRKRYIRLFQRMAVSLAARQSADGLWRSNLDDPQEFPKPETSGSGFFCFGLAWGINQGLLSRAEYVASVEKAWAGLRRCVRGDGQIEWGQGESDRPGPAYRDSNYEYNTGAFLLAASEAYKLTGHG